MIEGVEAIVKYLPAVMTKNLRSTILFCAAFCLPSIIALAADLTIPLSGPVSRKEVKLQCDEHAQALGLPTGPFVVTYLNGDGNSLAVLPINGHSLIFSGVISADGSRYAAQRFIWWDVGSRGIHLFADSGQLKEQTSCHVVR
jgi:membrane-bound inhibitor of C-type lysozyme